MELIKRQSWKSTIFKRNVMGYMQRSSGIFLIEGRSAMRVFRFVLALAFVTQAALVWASRVDAASDLKLAPGLSFDDDSSPNFPIQGLNLSEGSITPGAATVIFFGTSNCWNTAREAERMVKLYPRFRDRIHFVIVDLNHVEPAQQPLVAAYYRGYIPTITAIDSHGMVLYDQAGETSSTRGDTANLQHLLDSVH